MAVLRPPPTRTTSWSAAAVARGGPRRTSPRDRPAGRRRARRDCAARLDCGVVPLPGRPMQTADQSRLRIVSEQRQQRNPRLQQLAPARASSRSPRPVGHRTPERLCPPAVVRRGRCRRRRRRRRPCGTRRAASASSADWSRISVALRHPSCPGGRVPRRHSASRRFARPPCRAACRASIRSPTVHSSSALMSTGMASSTPSTSHGSVKSSAR